MQQLVVGSIANQPALREVLKALQKGTLDPLSSLKVELEAKFRGRVEGSLGGKLLAWRCWVAMAEERLPEEGNGRTTGGLWAGTSKHIMHAVLSRRTLLAK